MKSHPTHLVWIALLAVSLSSCAPTQPSPTPIALPAVTVGSPTLALTTEPIPSATPPPHPPRVEPTEAPTSPPPPTSPVATPTNTPTSTSLPTPTNTPTSTSLPPSPTTNPTPTVPTFHTWRRLAFPGQTLHTMSLHPTQDQVIYIGLGPDLQQSTDGGHSWQSLTQGLPTPPCTEKGAWQVAVNSARPEELYAYFPGQSPWLFQGCPAVLTRSDDGGSHWTPLALPKLSWPWGEASGGPSELVPQTLSLHPHPQTGDLYVWEHLDTDPRSGGAEALLRSVDKGQSWEELPMPPDYGTFPNHRLFGFYGGDEAVLYGVTQDVYYMDSGMNPIYLYRSVDGATHWEQVSLPESLRVYAPLPGTAGLYAAVAPYTNWQNSALELYRVPDLEGEKMGWLPRLGHVFPDGILRVDPGDEDVLVWTDRLRESLRQPPIEALHLSEDGGRTWLPLDLPQPLTINDLAVRRSMTGDYATLYLASDDGLWAYTYQRSPLSSSAQATATAVVANATATEAAAQAAVTAHAGSPPPGRFVPDPVLKPAWRDYSLDMYSSVAHAFPGWALEPAREVELAIQGFGYADGSLSEIARCGVPRSLLMWRSDTRQVYFLPEEIYSEDWEFVTRPCLPLYRVYLDTWEPGQPNNEDIPLPYADAIVPRFGVGKVWREHFYGDQGEQEGVRLYFAKSPEEHTWGKVQPFEQATMLHREDTGEIYVLFPEFAHQSATDDGLTTDPVSFKVEGR
jgi:hypothetical protein